MHARTALQKPRSGVKRAGRQTFWKRLLDALSWLVETSQLSITVKNVANSRCLVDMYILLTEARECLQLVYLHIFCVRLLQVCSFNSDGQCEGLYKRNEQKVQLSRFSFLAPIRRAMEYPGNEMERHYADIVTSLAPLITNG